MESQRTVIQKPESRSNKKRELKRSEAFQGFGPSLIADCARRPLQHIVFPKDLAEARAAVRKNIPVCPGVYGWLNPDDTLIYVGKSKSLRTRLVGYFATETADPKMARIRRHSRTLVWEPISHDLLSLIREAELIDRWRPPYNVQGQPERRQPGFVCISRGAAPSLFFAGQIPNRAALAIGPFAGRARLTEAIACLNYVFQLRDCPDKTKMSFSNQLQLFGNDRTAQCIRHELDTCLGPCAEYCSREAYNHNVDKATSFLRGRDYTIMDRLAERMQKAVEQLSFERACVLRDQLDQLKWLQRRIKQLATARRKLDGVWSLPGFDRQQHWMILRAGQLISCTGGDSDPLSATRITEARSIEPEPPQSHLEINLLLMLAAWIKKFPEQTKTLCKFDDRKGSRRKGRESA